MNAVFTPDDVSIDGGTNQYCQVIVSYVIVVSKHKHKHKHFKE